MAIRLFNTLTREKESFKPLVDKKVNIYTCGQTVYDDLHIGNARTYISWDVLVRYLRYKGYDVFHVQNFTDVGHLTDDADMGEDKIEKRAKERRLEPMELVERYIHDYWRDMDALNNSRPNISPRATGHIVEIIEMTKELLKKGYAYEKGGNVYYDITKFKDYTELAKLNLKQLQAGARVEVDEKKKHPLDFVLWRKAEKNHLMQWQSPWGNGFPGWHIECSVMGMKYLGDRFDIHGGGKDHIPVHHTNEIAQNYGYTGHKVVNYWLHTEFLTINDEKMSKSKGNFFTARQLIDKYGAETVRMFIIGTHYRSPLDFDEKAIEQAKNNLDKFYNTLYAIDNAKGGDKKELDAKVYVKKFEEAMDDDLNTPLALRAIYELMGDVNKNLNSKKEILEEAKETILKLGRTLGLRLERENAVHIDKIVNELVKLRKELRKDKDFKTADRIRESLGKVGLELRDEDETTDWVIA